MTVITNLRDLRSTPLATLEREFWSKGIPALPGEPRAPRTEDLDPSTMSLEQLVATQNTEMPSIARSAWLAGARVDTIDLPSDDGTDTLAETIPASHPAYDHLVTLMPAEAMTPEQRAAYDAFCADFAYKGGSVPYTIEDPAIRSRITWERHWRQSSDVQREGLRFPDQIDDDVEAFHGRMQFYSLIGKRLDRETFLARKTAWVARFLARTGLPGVPDVATFAAKRTQYAMLRQVDAFADLREAGDLLSAAETALLAIDEPEDLDATTSREAIDAPYLPSLSLLIYQAEQRFPALGDDATDKEIRTRRRQVVMHAQREHMIWTAWNDHDAEEDGPEIQVHFRSPRDADRYHRKNPDALYHSTLMEPEVDCAVVSLGTAE